MLTQHRPARSGQPLGLVPAFLLTLVICICGTTVTHAQTTLPESQAAGGSHRVYLPTIRYAPPTSSPTCPSTSTSYQAISVSPPPTDRPAALHADLNLAVRGWAGTSATLGLVDMGGDTHNDPPQLRGVFADHRTPDFTSAAQVYDWRWNCGSNGCRGALIASPAVTLLGLAARPGESVRSPSRVALIDSARGYVALVLYAEESRITLKYTLNDNVISGYTVHLEDVCVDPNLLTLYRQMNAAGRGQLPALRNDQPLGTARQDEVRVAVRDTGTFMDPRSRKDWWQR